MLILTESFKNISEYFIKTGSAVSFFSAPSNQRLAARS